MDTGIVEVRKNITIFRQLDDVNSFSSSITIDFIPDEVIVKYIVFTQQDPTGPDNFNTSIYTDLVSDYIGTFSDVAAGNSNSPNLIFTLKKPINGLYNFQLFFPNGNSNNNEPNLANRTGDLTLHLEFIKYKSEKQAKVY